MTISPPPGPVRPQRRRSRPQLPQTNREPLTAGGPAPQHQIPTATGTWRYSTGDDGCERGVYRRDETSGRWRKIADLPYVHARVVRRDGTGRRTGTDYLISTSPEGERALVDTHALRDGTWANRLGVALADDDRIIRAVATAVRQLAHAPEATEEEGHPRIDEEGRLRIPVPERLPIGYISCTPTDRTDALLQWRAAAEILARNPKVALVVGASAIAPFWAALPGRMQSHFVHMYGDKLRGKSTTMRVSASVWGDGYAHDASTVQPWNNSPIGLARFLGGLRILPAFLDEAGAARWPRSNWGNIIFEICEGARRTTAEARTDGIRMSAPWHGILISSGNGRITEGVDVGRFAGIPRRVVEISTPFTLSADDAEALDRIVPTCAGHLGAEIAHRYRLDDVTRLVDHVRELLPTPEADTGRALAKHLRGHVAGAMMIDQILDTGTALRDAALAAATEYLAMHGHDPEHDADRLLGAITEHMAADRAAWPTRTQYRAMAQPRPELGDPLIPIPQHGIDRLSAGVRDDDGTWVAVFPSWLHETCERLGLDKDVALSELYRRGILKVPEAARARGEWQSQIRLDPRPARLVRMYKFELPPEPDEQDEAPQATRPDQVPAASPPTAAKEAQPQIPDPATPPAAQAAVPVAASAVTAERPVLAIGCDRDAMWLGDERSVPPGETYASLPALLDRVRELMPEGGTIAITPQVAALIGYPEVPISALPKAEARRAMRCRALAEAAEAGWKYSAAGADAWTTFYGDREDERPSITIVIPAWLETTEMDASGDVMLQPDHDMVTAAFLLARWREVTGVPFAYTAGTTALRLIHITHTQPGRRWPLFRWHDPDSPAGGERALIWSRPLTDDEAAMGYVVGIDKRRAYLGAQISGDFCADRLIHTPPEGFDPSRAGYWLVQTHGWQLTTPGVRWDLLPDLTGRGGADGPHWLTTANVRLLLAHGMPEEAIVDGWLAPEPAERREPTTRRLLRPTGERLRDALARLSETDPDEAIVRRAVKAAYSETGGMLNRGTPWVHRPDWADVIYATCRVAILSKVIKVGLETGRWPFRIMTDCVYYATDATSPQTANPAPHILKEEDTLQGFSIKEFMPLPKFLEQSR